MMEIRTMAIAIATSRWRYMSSQGTSTIMSVVATVPLSDSASMTTSYTPFELNGISTDLAIVWPASTTTISSLSYTCFPVPGSVYQYFNINFSAVSPLFVISKFRIAIAVPNIALLMSLMLTATETSWILITRWCIGCGCCVVSVSNSVMSLDTAFPSIPIVKPLFIAPVTSKDSVNGIANFECEWLPPELLCSVFVVNTYVEK